MAGRISFWRTPPRGAAKRIALDRRRERLCRVIRPRFHRPGIGCSSRTRARSIPRTTGSTTSRRKRQPADPLGDREPQQRAPALVARRQLQVVRRQDHQRVDVGAVQSQARRLESRAGAAAWRSDRPDGRLLESADRGARLSRLHLHRAERAWLDRLRHGVPEGQLPGSRRRRSAGRGVTRRSSSSRPAMSIRRRSASPADRTAGS